MNPTNSALLALVLLFIELSTAFAQSVDMIHGWEVDPDIGSKWTIDLWGQPRDVDVAKLRSDKLQTQVLAAQTASFLTRVEVTNRQAAFDAALEQLQSPQDNHQARLAMVSAAINLAAEKQEVESVWKAVADESTIRTTVEPKLIEWASDAAIDVWRERVAVGESGLGAFRYNELLLAIDGLAVVGDQTDKAALQELLLRDGSPLAIQLAASTALGAVANAGLEPLAEQFLTSARPQHNLLAANLLAEHRGKSALELWERILDGANRPAQSVVYRAIVREHPQRARELANELIRHPENNLRMAAIMVLDEYDDAASLNVQAQGFADENPDVRSLVRENLERKAAITELRELVDEVVTLHLEGDRWQGIEQAMILAVDLEEHHRAPRLLTLLDHPQPQIFIRAAWALQMLELTPETLDGIFQHCQVTTQRLVDELNIPFEDIAKTAFLLEAIGRHRYQPAHEMLMLYVPKNDYKMGSLTRASAIYALGYLWQDSGNKQLAKRLAARMLDDNPYMPEDDLVQYTCAVALGRIKDPASVAELRKRSSPDGFPLARARDWSLQQLAQ